MFNKAIFRVILLTSSDNVNYVAHIYRNYTDLDGKNGNADLGEKKFCNEAN